MYTNPLLTCSLLTDFVDLLTYTALSWNCVFRDLEIMIKKTANIRKRHICESDSD